VWLIIPSSALPSAPALTDSSSDLASPSASDTEPLLWSNGKYFPPRRWRRDKRKAQLANSLNGTTLPPLTASRGVECFISSLRASLVNPTLSPESAKALPTNDGYGPTSPASSKNPRPPSFGSKTSQDCLGMPIAVWDQKRWKTAQTTLWAAWAPFSGVWPISATMRDGAVYSHPTRVPRISEPESLYSPSAEPTAPPSNSGASGLWPTAQAHDAAGSKTPEQIQAARVKSGAGISNLNESASMWKTPHGMGNKDASGKIAGPGGEFVKQANQWTTPKALTGGANSQRENRNAGGPDLQEQVEQWQTPATDSFRSRSGERAEEMGLDQQARFWASPRGEDSESCGNHPGRAGDSLTGQTRFWNTPHCPRENDSEQSDSTYLGRQIQQWASPQARDTKSGECSDQTYQANSRPLSEQVLRSSPQDRVTNDGPICWCGIHGCALPSHRRKLNPLFVVWLMGWPLHWLTIEPVASGRAETALYLSRQRSLLSFWLGAQEFSNETTTTR